jgi:hypothetical protein
MKRAGKRTVLEIRRQRMVVVKRMWWRYLVILAGFAMLAAFTALWMRPMWAAYFAGLYTAGWLAIIGYSLMMDGSHFRMMGAEAETWTSRELRKVRGLQVIDAVEFADRDVDHIAISASQILAVETKWSSRTVRIDEDGVHGLYGDGMWQAERGAKRIENLLRSRGVDHPVIPVLVLWGAEVPRLEGGYRRVGEVRVLIGKQAVEWRAKLAGVPQGSESSTGAREVIEEYMRGFDERRRLPVSARLRAWLGLA